MDKAGKWRFNLKTGNGEIILKSEAYESQAACDNGIESVRVDSPLPPRYEKLTSVNGKLYFNLKADNYQVIGTSEMYESEAGRDNRIATVERDGPVSPAGMR